MNIIEQLLAIIGIKKQKNSSNNDNYISQRQLEMMATPGVASESVIPNKGGPDTQTVSANSSVPIKGGPMEAIEAVVSSPYDKEVQTANHMRGNLRQQPGGYQNVSPSELIPIEGHPGQFTNGGGKGGHDPSTGYSMGTYPVYDANGNFLGENATLVQGDTTTNFGFSYGTPIPRDIDLSKPIMSQQQALQSAGLNGDELTSFEVSGPDDNKDTRNSMATDTGKGGPVNGVDTAIPAGMVGTPDGLIMNQETALRSAGLDMSGLGGSPNKGGPSEASAPTPLPTAGYDPAEQYNAENVHIPSIEEVQAASYTASAQNANPAPASSFAPAQQYSATDVPIPTANEIQAEAAAYTSAQPQSLSQQRLQQGRMQRLDPEGMVSGGANFDIAGPTENPVDSFGGASGDHQAV